MRLTLFAAAAAVAVAACSPDTPTEPSVDLRYAKGGSGGGGPTTTTTGITPVQIANSRQLGCSSSAAYAISEATASVVGGYCTGQNVRPFLWSATGSSVYADTGIVRDVTLNGTAFGELDFKPFMWQPGSNPVFLPMPAGHMWGGVNAVSDDGRVAAGYTQWQEGNNTFSASAIWTWDGASWSISTFDGSPNRVNANGTVLVGGKAGHATLWTLSGGVWSATTLPDGGTLGSTAHDINEAGNVIVGSVRVALPSDPSVTFNQQVAWIRDGGGVWNLKQLAGINIREGEALSVADQPDGSTVAVGWGWEDKTGGNEQHWAFAWKLASGATQFGAPILLNPVTKGAESTASDINRKGEIVGTSTSKLSNVAVMWKLQ